MTTIWGFCDVLMNMTRLNSFHEKNRRSIEHKFVDPQITFIWHQEKSLNDTQTTIASNSSFWESQNILLSF